MKKLLSALLLAGLFAGCVSEPPPAPAPAAPMPAEPAPPPPPPVRAVNEVSLAGPAARPDRAEFRQVVLDGDLAQWIAVQEVRRGKTRNGYEKVDVRVKNMTTSQIRVRYAFKWQDAAGMEVEDPDHPSEKFTFQPGASGKFSSIAPAKGCRDFLLGMQLIQPQQ